MDNNKWKGLLYFIILTQFNTSTAFDETEGNLNANPEESPLVEVRAVYINCETKESVAPDSDSIRFEREELFKHSVLRDCNKKLAVTVKISSEADDSSGDEYLPIEHVFEGPDKKRVRLLDPYILRLRREPPLQAYKLRRVDNERFCLSECFTQLECGETISGILVDTSGKTYNVGCKNAKSRIERDVGHSEAWSSDNQIYLLQTKAVTPHTLHPLLYSTLSDIKAASQPSRSYVENDMCPNTFNTTLSKRKKRSEHNIVVEEASDDSKQWNSKENYYRISEPVKEGVNHDIFDDREMNVGIHHAHHRPATINYKKETTALSETIPLTDEITNPDIKSHLKKLHHFRITHSKEKESKAGRKKNTEKSKTSSPPLRTKERKIYSLATNKQLEEGTNFENTVGAGEEEAERDYAVYEIGQPEVWYTVNVQLFEKLSTSEGKTVWNDLTKGEQASVSSKTPEWMGQDLNVRYRPAEWVPREEFSLPTSSLCLLAPVHGAKSPNYSDNSTFFDGISEDGGYIVLPEADVMGVKDEDDIVNKRNDNNTDFDFSSKSEERNNQGRRRVVVRTSSALLSGAEEKVNIAFLGTDKYLTLPHRRPHHAQIDLEARADENEVIRVGASGRIAIAVADSTRRTRTILTLQVGNTGLAAARFSYGVNILASKDSSVRNNLCSIDVTTALGVVTRDCGPALSELVNEKNKQFTTAGPVMIPPRHTRSLRLELPVEIPIDMANCSVSLVNDDDKSIAVREVAIKKGDRCFCVWHCDCVCLTDDPRLLCHEMAEARQTAAGLSNRDRTRHARSACYQDVVYINVCIIVLGVIFVLLVFGCIKACLGLGSARIASWGLDQLIQIPRKIDHYYESNLKDRKVEYDCDGWPVHPDTMERTIRMYSRSMEFILNVIFFLCAPCMLAYDRIKVLYARFVSQHMESKDASRDFDAEKCFSTQDMQAMAMRWRRRHDGLRRWMTPPAQELSKDLWKKGLWPSVKCEFMRPLLREGRHAEPHGPDPRDLDTHDSCLDSEQDDTDYVITQMQKSRESLSILKQKTKP